MAWAAVGAAAVSVVGGSMLSGSGSSGGGGTPAQYDPFQSYRPQFAGQVGGQLTAAQGAMTNASTVGTANAAAQGTLAGSYATQMGGLSAGANNMSTQMQALAANPSAFLNTAPSQAYLGQVQQATGRQAAATGMFSSGNEQLALQNNILAGSQALVGNQMNILGQGQTSAVQAGNMTGQNLTSGFNANTGALNASTAAAQQGAGNQGAYLNQLMQLAGATQSPGQGYQAGISGNQNMVNNMVGMAGVGSTIGTALGNYWNSPSASPQQVGGGTPTTGLGNTFFTPTTGTGGNMMSNLFGIGG